MPECCLVLLGVGKLPPDAFVPAVWVVSLLGLLGSGWYCFKSDSSIDGGARLLWFGGALVWILAGAIASLATGWWIALANLAPVWVLKEVAD